MTSHIEVYKILLAFFSDQLVALSSIFLSTQLFAPLNMTYQNIPKCKHPESDKESCSSYVYSQSQDLFDKMVTKTKKPKHVIKTNDK